jgi:hypothetical protein
VRWEPLPEPDWRPTVRSLHRWSQVAGKIRMALAPPTNHWWHVALYVSARGLTTSPMPCEGGLVELEFDLRDDVLRLRTSDDRERTLALRPMSVADFYAEARALLAAEGMDVRIHPVPVEVEDAVPFAADTAPGDYDPEHARALHGALVDAARVMARFRGEYLGKASPVHFFWGGFDLAASRFSGRRAPRHPGGIPNCPSYVMDEAYSHEVSSAGWWPGAGDVGAAFYAYMYPEPDGYARASLAPAPGAYHDGLREFVLPHREVVAASDPDAAVLAFLEATYAAGATLAGWDRGALERPTE